MNGLYKEGRDIKMNDLNKIFPSEIERELFKLGY